MTRSFVQWGVSALNDEPLIGVSPAAQGAFPWLLLQAALSDGHLSKAAAMVFLRGRGWDDPAGTVDELYTAGLILPDGTMSGWDKYQARYSVWNEGRATTKEGRRLGLSRDEDAARIAALPVDSSTPSTPPPALDASTDIHVSPPSHPTPPPVDTVDASMPTVPSPLVLSRLHDGDTTENNGGEGGPGGTDDRDIQDALYELTTLRPWGKEWGKRALALAVEFGPQQAETVLRRMAADRPGSKPWDLIKWTGDRLERDRDKAKSADLRQATADRAGRGKAKPDRITPDDYAKLTTYKEPEARNG